MISSVQFLRFMAAFGVLCAHSMSELGIPRVGSAGVDLFFVISGFIMVVATEQSGDRFLIRRIARLVPLAWVVTLAYVALKGVDSAGQLVASLLFMGQWHSAPAFGLMWTLEFEMAFYLIFAAAMLISHKRRVEITAGALLMLMAMGFDPILLEFALGILVARVYQAGYRLSAAPAFAVAIVVLMIGMQALIETMDYRALMYGGSGAALLWAMLSIDDGHFRKLSWLGDISYSMYVWHLFVIGAVVMVVDLPIWLFIPVVLAITIAVSSASYRWIECPARRWISGWQFEWPDVRPKGSGAKSYLKG